VCGATRTHGSEGRRSQQCDLLTRHIAMRLQHAEKTAGTLPADTPERENARAAIVAEVNRLHWRIWNGKAKDAKVTLERIHTVMPTFQGEQGGRKRDPSSHRLWTALREIDRYPISQSAWLVNYAERHRAGLRVGTALTEGTASAVMRSERNSNAAPQRGLGWRILDGWQRKRPAPEWRGPASFGDEDFDCRC
jgi:hypothetical protein